jgi:hypothetical protein
LTDYRVCEGSRRGIVSIDLLVRSLLAIGASPKDIGRAIGRDAA